MSEFEPKTRVVCFDGCAVGTVVRVLLGGNVSVLWDGQGKPTAESASHLVALPRRRGRTVVGVA